MVADELQATIPQHRAREEAGLQQDLEPVADAEHRPAGVGEGLDRGHHRREPRDRAGPQVVAVREAAGQDDHVSAAERRLLVPDESASWPSTCFAA